MSMFFVTECAWIDRHNTTHTHAIGPDVNVLCYRMCKTPHTRAIGPDVNVLCYRMYMD